MKQSKKKKRSRVSKKGNAANEDEQKTLKNLVEAFDSVSLEEAASAYREANGDPHTAAEILTKSAALEDQSTTCSSSSGNCDVGSSLSSNATLVFGDANDILGDGFKLKGKPKFKKVVASAGTVSTVLGKDYVSSTHKKGSSKLMASYEESWREQAEQFLCSMLGHDCELSLAIVRDILCQCGYNVNKALDILLKLSASSTEQSSGSTSKEDAQYMLESNNNLIDRTSDSTTHSSDIELLENVWFASDLSRDLSKISQSGEPRHSTETANLKSEYPQKVLKSLFNMPTPKSAKHEPSTMNWRNVVKKMTPHGPRSEPSKNEQVHLSPAKGDEYQVLREPAKQLWDSTKSYYERAATAFTEGKKEHAAYLSEQGRLQNNLAREADEKASQDIFAARNKDIANVITIDLHGQHVKQAMKFLKLHIQFGASVRSVRSLRVITGCGSHGVGKSKLKNSVIDFLQKEGIAWSEENRGTLLIRLDGLTDFSFLDSGSESD